ncbi:hypothetical protein Tco_1377066 [Tanacetum coccineum]
MSNTNNNLQTQTSNALHNAIMEVGGKDRPTMLAPGNYNPPYKFKWTEKTVPVAEAKVVQIILIGIDNDIYFTVDACPNSCEMWKAIERLKQGESINVQDLETSLYWEFGKFTSRDGELLESYYLRFVTLVKQSQELKTVSYHKLYDILKQHQNEVNEIRAERLARTTNPLALEPAIVTEDDEMSKEKKIDKLMALISLSFKKIYKPTNNNLRTSSNTNRANQDNSPRINRGFGYENQRVVNVAGARENVGTQLNAEQADWKDDTDDESDDQELKAHYMYMAQIQEVTPDAADNSGPIFDAESLQKVQNNDDNYNMFAIENEHPKQPKSINDTYLEEQGDTNITINSLDMCYNRDHDNQDDTNKLAQERDLLASLIKKIKCEIDDRKNH